MHDVSSEPELPDGLYICIVCGEARGSAQISSQGSHWTKSTCLCEGLDCRECGRRLIRRPITNYYNWRTERWWHVPYFATYGLRCGPCRKAAS